MNALTSTFVTTQISLTITLFACRVIQRVGGQVDRPYDDAVLGCVYGSRYYFVKCWAVKSNVYGGVLAYNLEARKK